MLVEICLPVKNEANILALNLKRILDFCEGAYFTFDFKIVGLVNGSSDETIKIFSEFRDKYPAKISFIETDVAGKGRAIREYWKKSSADILSYMDIDLAVMPDELPRLFEPIIEGKADLVIGSRLMVESNTNRSLFRETTSRLFNITARLLLPSKVFDRQCGFKAINAQTYKKIAPYLKDNYWLFDTELIEMCNYFSYVIKEIPVAWDENRYQKRKSKVLVFRDMGKFLLGLLRLRISLFFIRKNQKISR